MIEILSAQRKSQLSTLLTWVLGIALLVSIGSVGYLAVNPPETTEPFTEFYILGPDGNASGYPTNLTVNESGEVIVGITNHEHRTQSYTVLVALANSTVEQTTRVADGETWERQVAFSPRTVGQQQVEILLYKGDAVNPTASPYRQLRLWVNVTQPTREPSNTTGT